MSQLLTSQFSGLFFARSADNWLANIKKRNIAQQLLSRKIRYLEHTFSAAGYLCLHQNSFLVLLNPDMSYREKCLTLGHEIGHTFHCDLRGFSPQFLLQEEDDANFWNNVIEPFCEAFGEKWLSINGVAKFVDFSRGESKKFYNWSLS